MLRIKWLVTRPRCHDDKAQEFQVDSTLRGQTTGAGVEFKMLETMEVRSCEHNISIG